MVLCQIKNFRPAGLSRSASCKSDKYLINYVVLQNPCFVFALFGGGSRSHIQTESVFASSLFSTGSLWEFHKSIAHRIVSLNKLKKGHHMHQMNDKLITLFIWEGEMKE